MYIPKQHNFKKVFLYTILSSALVACGGSGDSKNSSEGGSNIDTPVVSNNLNGSLSIVRSENNNDYSLHFDLKNLATQLKIPETSLVNTGNCEQNNHPSFGDAIIKLTKGTTVKTLFLPVTCNNVIDTKIYDIAAGIWLVEATVYNASTDELLVAKSNITINSLNESKLDLVFNKSINQQYYNELKNISDLNLAQEVSIVPTDYMSSVKDSFVYLASSARDYIGAGKEYFYAFEEFNLSGYKNGLQVNVDGYDNSDWTGDFALPDSYTELSIGLFPNLYRYSFSNPRLGGLSWTGNGRACNTSKSWMRVDQITFEDEALRSIDYRFAQHCESDLYSALFGMVHWRSPRTMIGTKWQPTLESIPAGNYIALESDKGDYVGGGKNYLFNSANANINILNNNNVLNISVNGDTSWGADFALPDTQSKIETGVYKKLIRYPFHNPKLGGLNWSGDGRGCNQLEGWFIVDSVKYDNSGLQKIDLRFEQHCEGNVPALYGKIHWNRDNP
ncbi:MAG: hypothetical protein RSB94_07985 [Erysipelotrichaceae bacterium]